MGFQPRKGDTAAPSAFRRFIGVSDRSLVAAVNLIYQDYEHATSEQLLNVIIELHRRGEGNRLTSMLGRLADKRAAGDVDEPTAIRIV